MKKMAVVLLALVLFTSCATYNHINKKMPADYDYKLIYTSALLSLNDKGYTIKDHKIEDGVIVAENYGMLYSATTVGIFGIFPMFYTYLGFPTISIVIAKGVDDYKISITESSTTSLPNNTVKIYQGMWAWYNILSRPKTWTPSDDVSAQHENSPVRFKKKTRDVELRNNSARVWKEIQIGFFDQTGEMYIWKTNKINGGEIIRVPISLFISAYGRSLEKADLQNILGVRIKFTESGVVKEWTAELNEIME